MSIYIKRNNELYHAGKKGMKWGYNDGKPNGKRTADETTDGTDDGTDDGNNSIRIYNPTAMPPETEEAIVKYMSETSDNLLDSMYDNSPSGVQYVLDFMNTPISELFKTGVRKGAYKDK